MSARLLTVCLLTLVSAVALASGGEGGRGERLRDCYCNPNITSDATIAANKDEVALLLEPPCSRAY